MKEKMKNDVLHRRAVCKAILLSCTIVLATIFPALSLLVVGHAAPTPELVNYDPDFDNPELVPNQDVQKYEFWHPNTHGPSTNNAYISDGILYTRQNNNASTSWGSFDNAVAHQGHFPWETDCGVAQRNSIVFTCPRNTHGLLVPAHSDFGLKLSGSMNFMRGTQPASAEYNLIYGLYFYFPDGSITSPSTKSCSVSGARGPYRWLELQVRVTTYIRGSFKPVGFESCWDPGFDFGYSVTVATLAPGNSLTITDYDVYAAYRNAMAYWGFSPDTHAILVGIEPGTEGFGVKLDVDWLDIRIMTEQPVAAKSDMDFNHTIDINDLSLVQSLVGNCPVVFYTNWSLVKYEWRADVDSTNPCINSADVLFVQSYLGTTYSVSAPDFTLTASPTAMSLNPGSQGTSTIGLTSKNNFSGVVSLALSASTGLSASLSSPSVTLSSGGSATTILTLVSSTNGTYTVTVTGTSSSLSHSTSVLIRAGDRPPVLTPIADASINEESLLAFTATAADPDADPVSFSLSPGTPSGASITTKGDFSWTPTEAQGPGNYALTITVTDSWGASASLSFRISVGEVNLPPALAVPGSQTVDKRSVLTFTVSVTDPDTPANAIALSASSLPAGATFDPATRTFSWTPPSDLTGMYVVTFTATDNGTPSLSDTKTVAILVNSKTDQSCPSCSIPPLTSAIWLLVGVTLGVMLIMLAYNIRAHRKYSRLLRSRGG